MQMCKVSKTFYLLRCLFQGNAPPKWGTQSRKRKLWDPRNTGARGRDSPGGAEGRFQGGSLWPAEGGPQIRQEQAEGSGANSSKEMELTDCFMCLNRVRGFRKERERQRQKGREEIELVVGLKQSKLHGTESVTGKKSELIKWLGTDRIGDGFGRAQREATSSMAGSQETTQT